jgi:hypothetical protein
MSIGNRTDSSEDKPAWTQCDCCGDFYCNHCQQHAADCPCPPIDVWAEYGRHPYTDPWLFKKGAIMPDPAGYIVDGELWEIPDDYVLPADQVGAQ